MAQPEAEEDIKLDPNQEYSARDYVARLRLLAKSYPQDDPIQATINEQIEWAEGFKPETMISFTEDEEGIIWPSVHLGEMNIRLE